MMMMMMMMIFFCQPSSPCWCFQLRDSQRRREMEIHLQQVLWTSPTCLASVSTHSCVITRCLRWSLLLVRRTPYTNFLLRITLWSSCFTVSSPLLEFFVSLIFSISTRSTFNLKNVLLQLNRTSSSPTPSSSTSLLFFQFLQSALAFPSSASRSATTYSICLTSTRKALG